MTQPLEGAEALVQPTSSNPLTAAESSFRRVVGNILSLLTSDVVNRATTFILYLFIGRYLGAYEFGQISLALALFHTARVLAVEGLKILITREVARDRSKTNHYLVNGTALAIITSLLSMAILMGFVRLMNYSADTAQVIFLMSFALVPYGLSAILEGTFQAWERMHLITAAHVPIHILKVTLAFIMLSQGYGLEPIMLMLLGTFVALAIIEWGLTLRFITRPKLRVVPREAIGMIRESGAFLGINGVLAVRSSLNIVLLSLMANETEAGLYNSAAQFILPMMLIFESVGLSIFPVMCKAYERGIKPLKRVSEYAIELLMALTLPLVVGLFLLSKEALLVVYGEGEFVLASTVLRIIVWSLLVQSLTQILGRTLWASKKETTSLGIVTANTVIWFISGLILISQFGLIGAGLNLLLAQIVDLFLHYIPISRVLFRISPLKLAWKPLIAVTIMGGYVLLVRASMNVFVVVFTAAVLYGAALLSLLIISAGGIEAAKTRYLGFWRRHQTPAEPA
jgi:O-antigen/teichoic acid export membrane protein